MCIKINLKEKIVVCNNKVETFLELGMFEIKPNLKRPLFPKTVKQFLKLNYDIWLLFKHKDKEVELMFI